MSDPRYIPFRATFVETLEGPMKGQSVTAWGVLDNEESRFAPFGGNAALAEYAATAVEAKPDSPWSWVDDFTPAARFEWRRATYNNVTEPTTGVLDTEENRFAPFGYEEGDGVDGADVVADVARRPEAYAYTSDYKLTD
ncbi:hypothetical protein SEA_TFORTROY_56 [Arthrobacter phage TforTroy]|uniref:Major tail protein n=1 Tax=Arthrobacter phage TforTroy TaxID=3118973 RepID=A0ABZ2CNQ9_9CAUD